MILFALDLPDDPARLPGWLERHLVGMHLAELVAELSAVHAGPLSEGTSLQEVLGPRLELVLEEGLSVLPPATLQQLLREPRLLLDLQELILTSGESYWETVVQPSSQVRDVLTRGRCKLDEYITAQRRNEDPTALPFRPARWYRRPIAVSLMTAAAVLLAVLAFSQVFPPSSAPGWGWAKPGAMPEHLPAPQYLERLADGAGEWFGKRPETAPELAARISEFRKGCSTLIFAPHAPLDEEDRQWLVERCRAWAVKFDQQLVALEAGEDPLRVRSEMDTVVKTLIDKLRERANSLT